MNYRLITLTGVLIAIGMVVWVKYSTPSIVYVRSAEVVERYKGMDEAKVKLQEKKDQWQKMLEQKNKEYLLLQDSLGNNSADNQELLRKYQELVGLQKSISQKIEDEDRDITQNVLNQINAFIEQYSVKHDIDIVLGTTRSGSILYGKEYLDITDELIQQLNSHYLGEE